MGTSANISGNRPLSKAEDALKVFDGKVDIVLDGGFMSTGVESTVVRKIKSSIQILREGAISRGELRTALAPNVELQK